MCPMKPQQHRPHRVPGARRHNANQADRREHAKFYKRAPWLKLRKMMLAAHPMCAVAGCRQVATEVDHIRSVREAPDLALDPANLRCLCASHHSARTAREQSFNRRPPTEGKEDTQER